VFARALVAKGPLPGGVVLSQADLTEAEIDIAAEGGTVFTEAESLAGRTLMRALAAGEAVRSGFLKQRQWFAAGESVKVLALGQGYAVEGEGQALNAGVDGQDVRIRFESGRVVTGRATGERKVEVQL
jgi:flagella basal body P-ring formation protein FlgA